MSTKDLKKTEDVPAGEEEPVEEDKVVPAKGDASYDTPSGYALSKVGEDGDGDEYAKLKSEKRWGTS